MVYADISSLYENGEHYDSLYGGASLFMKVLKK